MNYQSEQIMQIDQLAEQDRLLTSIDLMREIIYQTDFEAQNPDDDAVLFEFWIIKLRLKFTFCALKLQTAVLLVSCGELIIYWLCVPRLCNIGERRPWSPN